jgi:hypothetical protein
LPEAFFTTRASNGSMRETEGGTTRRSSYHTALHTLRATLFVNRRVWVCSAQARTKNRDARPANDFEKALRSPTLSHG